MTSDATLLHRLNRFFPGERHWKSGPLCAALFAREDREVGGRTEAREPRTSRLDHAPRPVAGLPQVRPYAPQLIRLVRHPFAMAGVRVKRQEVFTPRAPLGDREPVPAAMRLAAEDLPRITARGPLRDRVLPMVFRQAWRSDGPPDSAEEGP